MENPKPVSEESTIFQGKIIEVVQQEFETAGKKITFEWARRAPGSRIILEDRSKKTILIMKEYRNELKDYDYRLPGGKVYDKLVDYLQAKNNGLDILVQATNTIIKESKEEAGIIPINPRLIKVSKCGATIEWDIYYFHASKWKTVEDGQDLELGENITVSWFSIEEVIQMCIDGLISEDRTRGVLLSHLLKM